jgi:hypothetical protein
MSRTGTLLLAVGLLAAVPAWAGEAERGAPPDTIEFPSSVGLVKFPHAAHANDMGLDCVVCHHETSAKALEVPHPDYFDDFWIDCATCHGERAATASSRRCASCHPARPAGPAVEMPSLKVAIHSSCWKCHEQSTGAEASAQCNLCHQHAERTLVPISGTDVDP